MQTRKASIGRGIVLGLLAWAAAVAPAGADGPSPALMLPDLDPEQPATIRLRVDDSRATPRVLLGFRSATENVGVGPLVIEGRRKSRSVPTMSTSQLIRRADGSTLARPSVGRLRYVRLSGHQHWHLLGFMRYELRRASDFHLVRPDQKTGFCLGDRYDSEFFVRRPFEPARAVFAGECGLESPGLRRIVEGISVGYGDDYDPHLEGQHIDITGIGSGRYWLVHRSNADGRLLESDHSNNASGLLLDVRVLRRGRRYRVTPLLACPAAERCAGPPRARAAVSTTVGSGR